MNSKLPTIIAWHMPSLRMLADTCAPDLIETSSQLREPGELGILPDGSLSPAEQRHHAAELLLQGVLHHLNSLVETSVQYLAGVANGEAVLLQKRTPSRWESLRLIETAYSTRAALLPGWTQIEQLRTDVNALKHSGGMVVTLEEPFTMFSRVRVDADRVSQTIDAAEAWLLALNQLVMTVQPSNARLPTEGP